MGDKVSKREKTSGLTIKAWIESIIIAILIAILMKTFLFNTVYIVGDSMNPTLIEKDRLISNVLPLYFRDIDRGDIVLIKAPDKPKTNESKKYIKRVIGLEGDIVEIKQGLVYLNEEKLNEEYIDRNAYTYSYGIDKWVVPEGEIFLLGDNRQDGASKDSRFFGTIPTNYIEGITRFRFFPVDDRFGKI